MPVVTTQLTRAVLTLASLLCIFSAMVGLTGVLLNSRPILAFYNLLLWPTLLSMCFVGYASYKRGNRQLDRKLNQTWSQFLDDEQRLRIQNSLRCCGYFSPMREPEHVIQSSRTDLQMARRTPRGVIRGQICRVARADGCCSSTRRCINSRPPHSPRSRSTC